MDKGLSGQGCPIPRRTHKAKARASQGNAPAARQAGQVQAENTVAGPSGQIYQVATLDFETDPFEHKKEPQAFAVGWYDGTRLETKWAEKEKEVIAWACERVRKFPGIVYAHNGGKFDFPGYLLKHAGKALHGNPVRMINGRIVSLRYGLAELRDSFAILPSPLREYDKGKIDYWKFRKRHRGRYKVEILKYLRRDVRSLRELVARFLGEHGIKPLTAASAAMTAIKASGVPLKNLSERQDEKFRQWYFGGRVECFDRGVIHGNFRVYDIKSAYPHAMLTAHAVGNVFKRIKAPRKILGSDFVCMEGMARGCFPRRSDKKDKPMTYPHASGTWRVTGWEYLAAKDCGLLGRHRVRHVERCTVTANFSAYVRRFYADKEEAERKGDRAGRLIAKILINAGYGKLAQRPDKWREFVIMPCDAVIPLVNPEGWQEEYVDEKKNFAVWSCPSSGPKHYYNVAAAASITGFVRARLIRQMHATPAVYCDTDSIVTRRRLACDAGLGGWGLEARGDCMAIAGKKLYGLRLARGIVSNKKEAETKGYHWSEGRAWKIASKGCRLTPKQLLTVSGGNTVVFRNQAPTFSLSAPVRWIEREIRMTA